MKKKLAVLMPTYNCAEYLGDSIDSILNQSYTDFDFYIYDDCSTDNTRQIILNYNDKRIFYVKNLKNMGISATLNLGFEDLLSKYSFIARMDADDWAFPERFQKQMNFLEENKSIMLCGTQGFWLKDMTETPFSSGKYPEQSNYIKLYLLFAASFGHSSVILRSSFFYSNNLRYNEEIKTCEDWDLWIRVSKITRTYNLPDYLMKYRIVSTSNHRSLENKRLHLKERSFIISNYWKTFGVSLSPAQIFEYYYATDEKSIKQNFNSKLNILIDVFNQIFLDQSEKLTIEERKKFSYMLARKILDFWKRSNINRYKLIIWVIILTRVKFITTISLIKSQLN